MYILYLGAILLVGYFFSLLVNKLGFPKIMGYLVAGLVLNPELMTFIPEDFNSLTGPATNFCLAFITFEIGSSFSFAELKLTGRKYLKLAFFESFGAFVLIFTAFFIIAYFIFPQSNSGIPILVSFSILLASLAAPTDPSATLAVIHEYKAKGPVTNSILGAAAFDDFITLILFSFSFSISRALSGTGELSVLHITYTILYKITGAVLTGLVTGIVFNKVVSFFKTDDKKSLIILFLGFLSLTFGLSVFFKFDELFSTLTLGFMIRNFNKNHEKILNITEVGMEELFFLIFFVLSAMHFDFHSFHIQLFILILGFIFVRALGKYFGMFMGTRMLKMSKKVQKYAFAGLIPQGGIILGLSLMIRKEPEFESFSNLLAGIIMGATIIHEFIGPLVTRKTLTFAGEIHKNKKQIKS
jgi:Kef-type K+ transport system membrane component KefB